MKIAIIGSGNIANTHAQELTGMGKKISLVVGAVQEEMEQFKKTWNIELQRSPVTESVRKS